MCVCVLERKYMVIVGTGYSELKIFQGHSDLKMSPGGEYVAGALV